MKLLYTPSTALLIALFTIIASSADAQQWYLDQDHAISGRNKKTVKNISVDEAKRICVSEGFQSFEYYRSSRYANFHEVSRYHQGIKPVKYSGYDLYSLVPGQTYQPQRPQAQAHKTHPVRVHNNTTQAMYCWVWIEGDSQWTQYTLYSNYRVDLQVACSRRVWVGWYSGGRFVYQQVSVGWLHQFRGNCSGISLNARSRL